MHSNTGLGVLWVSLICNDNDNNWMLLFFEYFIYFLFRKGGGKEKGRETLASSLLNNPSLLPTQDLAHYPGRCPDLESNLWPFGSQASAQQLSHANQG